MKNIATNKDDHLIGGIYGSSGAYLIHKLSDNFDNIILILNNNNEVLNFKDELSLFIEDANKISLYQDKSASSKSCSRKMYVLLCLL